MGSCWPWLVKQDYSWRFRVPTRAESQYCGTHYRYKSPLLVQWVPPPSFLPPGGIPLWATATLHLRHFVGLACTSLGVHSPQTAWGRRDRAATDVSSWENVACHARLPMPFRPQSWPCFPNKAESQDIFLCVLMPSTLCSLPSDSRYQ